MKYLLRIMFVFGIITVMYSCDSSVIYENEKTFKDGKWRFSDVFSSDFNLSGDSLVADVNIIVVHTDNYPYENIYLRLTRDFGTDKKIDTLTFNLSDRYGHWKGVKTWGGDYKYTFNYLKNCKISEKGKIIIEQFSRDETLSGVNKIEVSIKKER